MADFLTRLAERTLGVAPVVRPVIPPRFVPEAPPYPLNLEWEVETPLPDEPEETRAPTAREAPPRSNTPARRTRGAANSRGEDRGVAPPESSPDEADATPPPRAPPPDQPPDPRPNDAPEATLDAVPPRPTGTAVERNDADRRTEPPAGKRGDPQETGPQDRVGPAEREQTARETTAGRTGEPVAIPRSGEDPSPVATSRPRRTAEAPPGTRRPREAGPGQHEVVAPDRGPTRGSPGVPSRPEVAPGREAIHHTGSVVERAERVSLVRRAVPERGEMPASEAPAPPPATPDPSRAVSRTVGDLADARPRRGSPGLPPPEAPPIRVSIGRVEVRAVTPPPAPPPAPPRQQAASPARLSLDDYLRSRNGERR